MGFAKAFVRVRGLVLLWGFCFRVSNKPSQIRVLRETIGSGTLRVRDIRSLLSLLGTPCSERSLSLKGRYSVVTCP